MYYGHSKIVDSESNLAVKENSYEEFAYDSNNEATANNNSNFYSTIE